MNANEDKPNFSWVIENWKFIVLIFFVGGGYFQFNQMQKDLDTLHQRLDKKIKILNDHDNRIYNLDKRQAVHEAEASCDKQ